MTATHPSIERIREFMRTNKWSKMKLATEANVAEGTANKIFDDNFNPTSRTLAKLESVLPVSDPILSVKTKKSDTHNCNGRTLHH